MKKSLILLPSRLMDNNRKADRGEDKLIRMGTKARSYLELDNEKTVELWPTNTISGRINRSKVLSIFKAYQADLNTAKSNGMSPEEYLRVGFVTTRTFEYICGDGANGKSDIWISQSIDDTVIGGDPEFILLSNEGEVVYAGNLIDHNGVLASDGPLAELRPDPTIEAEDFVKSIGHILKTHKNAKHISDYKWFASCCWLGNGKDRFNNNRREWPVGGHIHIGTPRQVANKMDINATFRHFYYVTLNKILDELLGIPLMRVDNKEESIARRKHYGTYGSFRTEHGRLEYRTLSGMWMAHPKLALITLGVAKAIIDAYFQMLEAKNFNTEYLSGAINTNTNCFYNDFKRWDNMEVMNAFDTTMPSDRMIDILHNYNIKYDKAYIKKLSDRLRKLPTYRKYATHIDGLIELVSLPYNKTNKMCKDLKETWVNGEDFII